MIEERNNASIVTMTFNLELTTKKRRQQCRYI